MSAACNQWTSKDAHARYVDGRLLQSRSTCEERCTSMHRWRTCPGGALHLVEEGLDGANDEVSVRYLRHAAVVRDGRQQRLEALHERRQRGALHHQFEHALLHQGREPRDRRSLVGDGPFAGLNVGLHRRHVQTLALWHRYRQTDLNGSSRGPS
eukprot:6181144-Pleurochrysis_carterae.AAC.4